MKVNVRHYGRVAVVDIPGNITHGEGDVAMKAAVQDLIDSGNTNVILNLEKTAYMDSAGIGELVACHKRVVDKGGRLKLVKMNQKVLDLFTITKLIQLFDTFDDEKEAIASF
jgi:anti-sigma B factor antagonist